MASAPAVVSPPPLGITRLLHIWLDFASTQSQPGAGTAQYLVDRGAQNNGSSWFPSSGLLNDGPFQGFALNNICKQRGVQALYMRRTSGGVASSRTSSGWPNAVGAQKGAPPLPPASTFPAEAQQFWSYKLLIAQGDGGVDGDPPYGPSGDFGLFFFVNDTTTADSFGVFSPNAGLAATTCSQGVGLFLSAADGLWHYGVRFVGSGAAYTPLDVDIPLPYGGLWPATDPRDFVQVEWRWFSGTSLAGGGSHALLLNGKVLAASSLAAIGTAPTGAGFAAELPDYYGHGDPSNPNNAFGQFPVVRCSQNTGAIGFWSALVPYAIGATVSYKGVGYTSLVGANLGNTPDTSPLDWTAIAPTTGAWCAANIEYIEGPNLPTTY